ncbi:MAG: cob(I)yrinic acid a,c-diamide adenosyltransferase [Algisphaera sp.]
MKLYTRRGDCGQTDLYGGGRVGKDSLRVEAYGTVDELNSVVGWVRSVGGPHSVQGPLEAIQNRLFEMGADLATPEADGERQSARTVPGIDQEHVTQLERWIDEASEAAPPMTHFVLPGGDELAARLHMARCVCRRAERLCVRLAGAEPVHEVVVIYLNRLSDLLFALARRANVEAGVTDVPWRGRKG